MMIYRNEQGQVHRVDGPAITWPGGTQAWYLNDQLHRVDGPAIIRSNGRQSWYLYGKLHRLNGPAVIRAGGSCEWWINGIQVDEFTIWLLAGAKETV